MSHGLALAWTVFAGVMLHVVLLITTLIRPEALTDIVNRAAVEALVFVVGVLGILSVHAPALSGKQALGLRVTHPGLSVLGLGLGLAIHFPAESIHQVVERYFPTPSEVLAERAAMIGGRTPVQVILVLVSVACVGPLVEELFFRGAIYGSLRRGHTVVSASVTTAIAFVLGHFDPRLWPSLLAVAIVLGHLRAASGSLLPCLAMHVAFNTVTVLSLVSGASSVGSPMKMPVEAVVAGWVVTAGLVLWVQRLAASPEAAVARDEDE